MKVIVLFPANNDADTNSLIKDIYTSLENTQGVSLKTDFKCIPYPVLQILPTGKTFIKNKITIISGENVNKDNKNVSKHL